MAVIASRSSSDGRRTRRHRRGRRRGRRATGAGGHGEMVPAVAERLAAAHRRAAGRAPGGQLLPEAGAAGPEPREVPHQAQEPGARGDRRRCRGSGCPDGCRRSRRATSSGSSSISAHARESAVDARASRIFACEADRPVRGAAAAGGLPLPAGRRRDAARARARVGRGRVRPAPHGGAGPDRRPLLRGHRLRHAGAARAPRRQHAGQALPRRPGRPGLGRAHVQQPDPRPRSSGTSRPSRASSSRIDRRQPGARHRPRRDRTEAGAVEPFLHNYLVGASHRHRAAQSQGGDARPPSTRRRSPSARRGSGTRSGTWCGEMQEGLGSGLVP